MIRSSKVHAKKAFDHTGSSFDSFLEEYGILTEVDEAAIKRVSEWLADNTLAEVPPSKTMKGHESGR